MIDRYDPGLLGDGGGGNVEWWWDYIRAELDRAHEFYSDQIANLTALASQEGAQAGEVATLPPEIDEALELFGLEVYELGLKARIGDPDNAKRAAIYSRLTTAILAAITPPAQSAHAGEVVAWRTLYYGPYGTSEPIWSITQHADLAKVWKERGRQVEDLGVITTPPAPFHHHRRPRRGRSERWAKAVKTSSLRPS
ncbi:hypothetical protein [Labrys neptuniae]